MYSTIYYDTENAVFRNEKELNQKISELDSELNRFQIIDGDLLSEEDGYSGDFYADREFAELLSEYLSAGKVQLILKSEEDSWGYKITPGKVNDIIFVMMDTEEFRKYNEFKQLKKEVKMEHTNPDFNGYQIREAIESGLTSEEILLLANYYELRKYASTIYYNNDDLQ